MNRSLSYPSRLLTGLVETKTMIQLGISTKKQGLENSLPNLIDLHSIENTLIYGVKDPPILFKNCMISFEFIAKTTLKGYLNQAQSLAHSLEIMTNNFLISSTITSLGFHQSKDKQKDWFDHRLVWPFLGLPLKKERNKKPTLAMGRPLVRYRSKKRTNAGVNGKRRQINYIKEEVRCSIFLSGGRHPLISRFTGLNSGF